jgi:hypothetical protein
MSSSNTLQKRIKTNFAEPQSQTTLPALRKEKGTIGKPIKVAANYFRLSINVPSVYQYDLKFNVRMSLNRHLIHSLLSKASESATSSSLSTKKHLDHVRNLFLLHITFCSLSLHFSHLSRHHRRRRSFSSKTRRHNCFDLHL